MSSEIIWKCPKCSLKNDAADSRCVSCNSKNPARRKGKAANSAVVPPSERWICKQCGLKNAMDDEACEACGAGQVVRLSRQSSTGQEAWKCQCGLKNAPSDSECEACGASKLPNNEPPQASEALLSLPAHRSPSQLSNIVEEKEEETSNASSTPSNRRSVTWARKLEQERTPSPSSKSPSSSPSAASGAAAPPPPASASQTVGGAAPAKPGKLLVGSPSFKSQSSKSKHKQASRRPSKAAKTPAAPPAPSPSSSLPPSSSPSSPAPASSPQYAAPLRNQPATPPNRRARLVAPLRSPPRTPPSSSAAACSPYKQPQQYKPAFRPAVRRAPGPLASYKPGIPQLLSGASVLSAASGVGSVRRAALQGREGAAGRQLAEWLCERESVLFADFDEIQGDRQRRLQQMRRLSARLVRVAGGGAQAMFACQYLEAEVRRGAAKRTTHLLLPDRVAAVGKLRVALLLFLSGSKCALLRGAADRSSVCMQSVDLLLMEGGAGSDTLKCLHFLNGKGATFLAFSALVEEVKFMAQHLRNRRNNVVAGGGEGGGAAGQAPGSPASLAPSALQALPAVGGGAAGGDWKGSVMRGLETWLRGSRTLLSEALKERLLGGEEGEGDEAMARQLKLAMYTVDRRYKLERKAANEGKNRDRATKGSSKINMRWARAAPDRMPLGVWRRLLAEMEEEALEPFEHFEHFLVMLKLQPTPVDAPEQQREDRPVAVADLTSLLPAAQRGPFWLGLCQLLASLSQHQATPSFKSYQALLTRALQVGPSAGGESSPLGSNGTGGGFAASPPRTLEVEAAPGDGHASGSEPEPPEEGGGGRYVMASAEEGSGEGAREVTIPWETKQQMRKLIFLASEASSSEEPLFRGSVVSFYQAETRVSSRRLLKLSQAEAWRIVLFGAQGSLAKCQLLLEIMLEDAVQVPSANDLIDKMLWETEQMELRRQHMWDMVTSATLGELLPANVRGSVSREDVDQLFRQVGCSRHIIGFLEQLHEREACFHSFSHLANKAIQEHKDFTAHQRAKVDIITAHLLRAQCRLFEQGFEVASETAKLGSASPGGGSGVAGLAGEEGGDYHDESGSDGGGEGGEGGEGVGEDSLDGAPGMAQPSRGGAKRTVTVSFNRSAKPSDSVSETGVRGLLRKCSSGPVVILVLEQFDREGRRYRYVEEMIPEMEMLMENLEKSSPDYKQMRERIVAFLSTNVLWLSARGPVSTMEVDRCLARSHSGALMLLHLWQFAAQERRFSSFHDLIKAIQCEQLALKGDRTRVELTMLLVHILGRSQTLLTKVRHITMKDLKLLKDISKNDLGMAATYLFTLQERHKVFKKWSAMLSEVKSLQVEMQYNTAQVLTYIQRCRSLLPEKVAQQLRITDVESMFTPGRDQTNRYINLMFELGMLEEKKVGFTCLAELVSSLESINIQRSTGGGSKTGVSQGEKQIILMYLMSPRCSILPPSYHISEEDVEYLFEKCNSAAVLLFQLQKLNALMVTQANTVKSVEHLRKILVEAHRTQQPSLKKEITGLFSVYNARFFSKLGGQRVSAGDVDWFVSEISENGNLRRLESADVSPSKGSEAFDVIAEGIMHLWGIIASGTRFASFDKLTQAARDAQMEYDGSKKSERLIIAAYLFGSRSYHFANPQNIRAGISEIKQLLKAGGSVNDTFRFLESLADKKRVYQSFEQLTKDVGLEAQGYRAMRKQVRRLLVDHRSVLVSPPSLLGPEEVDSDFVKFLIDDTLAGLQTRALLQQLIHDQQARRVPLIVASSPGGGSDSLQLPVSSIRDLAKCLRARLTALIREAKLRHQWEAKWALFYGVHGQQGDGGGFSDFSTAVLASHDGSEEVDGEEAKEFDESEAGPGGEAVTEWAQLRERANATKAEALREQRSEAEQSLSSGGGTPSQGSTPITSNRRLIGSSPSTRRRGLLQQRKVRRKSDSEDVLDRLKMGKCALYGDQAGNHTVTLSELEMLIEQGGGDDTAAMHLQILEDDGLRVSSFRDLCKALRRDRYESYEQKEEVLEYLRRTDDMSHLVEQQSSKKQPKKAITYDKHGFMQFDRGPLARQNRMFDDDYNLQPPIEMFDLFHSASAGKHTLMHIQDIEDTGEKCGTVQQLVFAVGLYHGMYVDNAPSERRMLAAVLRDPNCLLLQRGLPMEEQDLSTLLEIGNKGFSTLWLLKKMLQQVKRPFATMEELQEALHEMRITSDINRKRELGHFLQQPFASRLLSFKVTEKDVSDLFSSVFPVGCESLIILWYLAGTKPSYPSIAALSEAIVATYKASLSQEMSEKLMIVTVFADPEVTMFGETTAYFSDVELEELIDVGGGALECYEHLHVLNNEGFTFSSPAQLTVAVEQRHLRQAEIEASLLRYLNSPELCGVFSEHPGPVLVSLDEVRRILYHSRAGDQCELFIKLLDKRKIKFNGRFYMDDFTSAIRRQAEKVWDRNGRLGKYIPFPTPDKVLEAIAAKAASAVRARRTTKRGTIHGGMILQALSSADRERDPELSRNDDESAAGSPSRSPRNKSPQNLKKKSLNASNLKRTKLHNAVKKNKRKSFNKAAFHSAFSTSTSNAQMPETNIFPDSMATK